MVDPAKPKPPADVKPPRTAQELFREVIPPGMAPHAVRGTKEEATLLVLGLGLIVLAFLPASVVPAVLLVLGGLMWTLVLVQIVRREAWHKESEKREWAREHVHECERGHIWSHCDADACLLPGRNQVNPHVSALRQWKARCGTGQAADCPECRGQSFS